MFFSGLVAYKVCIPDVWSVSSATYCGLKATRAACSYFCSGMEVGFQIHDEFLVYRTISHGLETANYVVQMHEYFLFGQGAFGT